MIIPLAIAGETGGHRSTQYGGEETRNMYIDRAEGKAGVHDFPGLKVWASKNGTERGSHVMKNALYVLIDQKLWKVDSNGNYTSLGNVSGSGRAIFADDGSSLYFTVNNELYKYSDGVTTISQSVVTNPRAIDYINRQFIITGKNGLFGTSDVANGDSYNALNYAEAEVRPDELQRPYVFSQLVYMLGDKTTELWYNTGTGNPPFERKDSALVNVGIAGKHAVTNTDRFLYWLGDDRKVYQCTGANARPVNSPAFSHAVEAMSDASNCVATSFVFQGQDFVLFNFTTGSWLFSETLNYWVELSHGVNGDPWLGRNVVNCYGKTLVCGAGGVYELDSDTYTDNGATRLRVRTLPNIKGEVIRQPGSRITVSHIRLHAQVGVGLPEGQGEAPVLMCEFSPDGGMTWQAEQLVSLGENGDYMLPVDFYDFCTGYNVRARISCSDPVYLSLFDGEAVVAAAGY